MKTGEVLDKLENHNSGEIVKTIHIANDPFNFTIEQYYPEPPSYGSLNKEKPPRVPLIRNWREVGNRVLMDRDIHLYYPSALKPNEWLRESPGTMTQVTEAFSHYIDRDQLGILTTHLLNLMSVGDALRLGSRGCT